jgi:hypothetical protein
MGDQPNGERRNINVRINGHDIGVPFGDLDLTEPDPAARPNKVPVCRMIIAAHFEIIARDIDPHLAKTVQNYRAFVVANDIMVSQIRNSIHWPALRNIALGGTDRDRNVPDVLADKIKLRGPVHANCDVSFAVQQVPAFIRGHDFNGNRGFFAADARNDIWQMIRTVPSTWAD